MELFLSAKCFPAYRDRLLSTNPRKTRLIFYSSPVSKCEDFPPVERPTVDKKLFAAPETRFRNSLSRWGEKKKKSKFFPSFGSAPGMRFHLVAESLTLPTRCRCCRFSFPPPPYPPPSPCFSNGNYKEL